MMDFTNKQGRRWYRAPSKPQRHALESYRVALTTVAQGARRIPEDLREAFWEGVEPFRAQSKAAFAALASNDPIRIADQLHAFQALAGELMANDSRPRQHWSRRIGWQALFYRAEEALRESDGEAVELLGELLEGVSPDLVQQLAA